MLTTKQLHEIRMELFNHYMNGSMSSKEFAEKLAQKTREMAECNSIKGGK